MPCGLRWDAEPVQSVARRVMRHPPGKNENGRRYLSDTCGHSVSHDDSCFELYCHLSSRNLFCMPTHALSQAYHTVLMIAGQQASPLPVPLHLRGWNVGARKSRRYLVNTCGFRNIHVQRRTCFELYFCCTFYIPFWHVTSCLPQHTHGIRQPVAGQALSNGVSPAVRAAAN